MKKVFLLASERSGSNLLRILLGNHKEIAAPVAPHFLNFFGKIIHKYGDLRNDANLQYCINDFLDNANHKYHNWQFDLTSEERKRSLKIKRNLVGITNYLYSSYANKHLKTTYVSKGINNLEYVGDILNNYPDAKFIYLHRDPRDHTASWLKTPLFMHSPFVIIQKWIREQDKCLYLLQSYPDSIIKVSYEELITDTQFYMTKILKFLELDIDTNCFQTQNSNTESKRNEFWKNLSKPIEVKNKKKYLNTVSHSDLKLIETLAESTMKCLGYTDFETDRSWNKSKSYVFHLKDIVRRVYSRAKHKSFYNNTMKDLKSKLLFQAELKSKLSNRKL